MATTDMMPGNMPRISTKFMNERRPRKRMRLMQYATESTKNTEMMHTKTAMMNVFMNMRILVYSAGTGAGFYVMKGYMDTIPTSLDEAAMLDGCTRWQVFTKIIIPMCRPMIVYQAIVGFLTPWLDFVMAKVIARTQENYTASLGLWLMLDKEYINSWFGRFACAGS